ncbi:double zinc ribbon domain-containing protein [Paenibacillus sp. PSB04]|uniref:double zinc ribbon domain-containing protein n=1 Tax=Paenibacillus sp. PSB04 TaxID=2866810 RepID=UPI0021F1EC2E|nr:zinc ribbon domain-containing protein [Paenibacillus sp. PSB04]UYO02157.1 zinc ribbon domain-containing protein [Paenibacillus sp. PSB04]
MSNFFNKIKQGVSDAGKKAQNTVESTTLKFQAAAKEKEIEKNYTEIGRIVHQSLEKPDGTIPSAEIQKYREAIFALEEEVEELQRKIQHLQNLKECGCGKMLPADATYCPFCGQQFHTVVVQPAAVSNSIPKSAYCTKCGEPASFSDHFCRSCGHKLQHE